MGDFNSRVGKLNDFIEVDGFLTNVIHVTLLKMKRIFQPFFSNIDILTVN